ncbi:MAG: hypothetical protein H3C34_26560, partial [Caldilineaceae bacterium]|nr:hypothetical protein [Caldilineaceae bacterium]
MADQHESFILRIEETGAGDREFRVTAEFRGGSRTELISDLDARLPADDIEQALAWLDRGFVERDYVRELGQRLFDLLFPASVAGLLREALQSIAPEETLRIVLYVPDSLSLIPWELAYDDEDLGFLARADKASLARHFHNLPVPNAAPAHGPLRMLVITASPHGLRPLGEEAEAEAIEAAFAGRQNRLLFWW